MAQDILVSSRSTTNPQTMTSRIPPQTTDTQLPTPVDQPSAFPVQTEQIFRNIRIPNKNIEIPTEIILSSYANVLFLQISQLSGKMGSLHLVSLENPVSLPLASSNMMESHEFRETGAGVRVNDDTPSQPIPPTSVRQRPVVTVKTLLGDRDNMVHQIYASHIREEMAVKRPMEQRNVLLSLALKKFGGGNEGGFQEEDKIVFDNVMEMLKGLCF